MGYLAYLTRRLWTSEENAEGRASAFVCATRLCIRAVSWYSPYLTLLLRSLHPNHPSEALERLLREWFGECVGLVLGGVDVVKIQLAHFDPFPGIMVLNVYVLRSRVNGGVLSEGNGSLVVTSGTCPRRIDLWVSHVVFRGPVRSGFCSKFWKTGTETGS